MIATTSDTQRETFEAQAVSERTGFVRLHVAETLPRLDEPLVSTRARWRRNLLGAIVTLGTPLGVLSVSPHVSPTNRLAFVSLCALAAAGVAVLLAGRTAGLTCVAFSAVAMIYASASPRMTFSFAYAEDRIAIGSFALVGLFLTQALAIARVGRKRLHVARRRLSFLAEASERLSQASLDFERTLGELASLSIRYLADLCTVYMLGDGGALQPIVSAHGRGVDASRAESLLHVAPPPPGSLLATATSERRSELLPRVEPHSVEAIAGDALHANLLRGLRARSAMIVPINGPRHTFGCVLLVIPDLRGRYSEEEISLVENLAARAGTALENVMLYEERTKEARTLANSLLPSEVATIPGLDVAVRFKPAGSPPLIGGDFYDVFALDEDRYAIVVGDVCGKGVVAASTAALARHTIRATSWRDPSPSRNLLDLNAALLRHATNLFCTVAFGILEGTELRLAIAGHPLPFLLTAAGVVEPVGRPGMLLGVVPHPAISESTLTLSEGDTIVLYTDGLLDERAPEPEEILQRALEKCAGLRASAILDELESTAVETDDDIALVALQSPARQFGSSGARA